MEFELNAVITFSAKINKAKNTIEVVIKKANEDLLKRGVPSDVDGGAEVVDYDIEGDKLNIALRSDRYVRAHDALLRLRKKLSREVGIEHHIGVRDIQIKRYKIDFEIEKPPKKEFEIPFVDKIKFNRKRCELFIEGLTEEQLSKNYVDRIVKRVKEKIESQYYGGKEEKWNLLWKSEEKNIVWDKDPTEEMEKRGWIKRGPTKGKWFYRAKATKIMKTMEKIAVEEILKPLDFEEVIESMMVPFDIWLDTGHMEGVPNEIYYISEPKTRDPLEWEHIIDEIKITNEVPLEKLDKMTTLPRAGVCYAQCPVIYWSLKNQTISDDSLPILLYERRVPSARYESGGRHGIERVDEFHRIEPVYIGTKEQLIDLKKKLIERYKHVFEDILEIEWRIAKVTPFYLQQAGKEANHEETQLGTVDFEAYLPYRGTRDHSEWLEFQNLSLFKKYTEAFNIKSQTKELYSGCTGIGLERWTAAFLAQKGLDCEKWPKEFRRRFGNMPKGIELL
ncbi:MAG: aminoacyl--tRNA ligase-related protein [Thermoplasmatota archaeon]